MTSYGPLIQFALLSGFVLAVTLTLLIGACERLLHPLVSAKTAAQRARLCWWLLVMPALAGIAYALMVIVMSWVFRDFSQFTDVCSTHADKLLHLCIWHPNGDEQSAWLWGALALLAGYAAWLSVRTTVGLWRARRSLVSMLSLSWRPGHPDKLRVLDLDQPIALACGIGQGYILLSTSLMRRLDATQLRVVVAHEQAHIANRDVLHRLIAIVLSSIQLSGTRRRLLRDLELALEQRCDCAAANEVGCPVAVAETIVAVEKIYRQHAKKQMPLSMAFFSDFVPERVEALLSPGQSSASCLGLILSMLVLAFCILSMGWLHAVTEFLINLLTR